MSGHIAAERHDGVVTLILDRPDKKNALTDAMYGALADAIEAAGADPAVRVVLLRGEGDMFTAGNDIGDFLSIASGGTPGQVHRFLRAIATFAKPIVAAVQGRAIGIGTTLLLHCDLVILAEDAVLSTPFVNLALVPEAASSLLLPQRIGHARAFAMFAFGETVNAVQALDWGLANRIVPGDQLRETAMEMAKRLARQPFGALLATKRLMRPVEPVVQRIGQENEEFIARLASAEAREAFTAFSERRAPDFSRIG